MKWSVIGLVLLGVAAAVCAAVLTVALGVRTRQIALPGAESGARVTVIVAEADLPALSVVTAAAVTKKQLARESAPSDYFSDPVQIVGKVLALPMTAGQPFTAACFISRGPGSNLAAALPEGKRAVTVTLTDAASLGDLIYPGATVDVIASFRIQHESGGGQALSSALLQGIEVLAVEGETVGSDHPLDQASAKVQGKIASGAQSLRVTVLVTPKQAEALQLAMIYGNISLAMRNPKDTSSNGLEVTLLNEGQMGPMGSWVPFAPLPTPTTPVVAPPPPTPAEPAATSPRPGASVFDKPSTGLWDVTILRGSASESRSYPAPKSSHPGDAP
jgi:pilus assembly protein CpaB